jgi:hypothetical protein
MEFAKVYKPPFHTDEAGLFIKASNGVKAFTVAAIDPKEEADNMVALLNDEGGKKYRKVMLFGGDKIVTSDASVFVTRGYGYLIGNENLSPEDAFKVQDDFIHWVLNKITDYREDKKDE